MTERTEEELLEVVRTVWEQRDPVPAGLVARLQEAAALADGSQLGLDLELMLLVERSEQLTGARGGSTAYTLRFTHGGVDLLLRVTTGAGAPGAGTARVDGWVVPPAPLTVRLLREGADDVVVEVPETGRFELTDLTPGLLRLQLEPVDGSTPFVTPAFEI